MALRPCVWAVVEERKAAGDLAQHIVVFVKRAALEAGVEWTNYEVFDRLIDWTLEAYWNRRP
jgi:hypothetical protein